MLRRHGERREDTTIVQKKKDANHRKFIHILFHVAKTSISALLSNYNDVCLSDVDIDTEKKMAMISVFNRLSRTKNN